MQKVRILNNTKVIITNGVNARKNIKTTNMSILPPPVLLIFVKQTPKLLIFISIYQIYTLIFYNFTKTKAVLLQATGLKHLAYEILQSE